MAYKENYSKTHYLSLIAKVVSKYKQRTYELMQIRYGDKVLDVGCGPATDTILLASLVGKNGQVVGVDNDKEQIIQANQRAIDAKVGQWVAHCLTDGHQLPFDSNFFNSVRSERVFQHSLNSNQLLQEMIRVTKPGGWIVVFDTDWSTMTVDTDLIDIEQKIKKYHVENAIINGYAGRQLYRMFLESGLHDIYIEMAPTYITDYQISRQVAWLDLTEKSALEAGIISQQELEKLHTDLVNSDFENKYFAAILQMLVAGRKPYQ